MSDVDQATVDAEHAAGEARRTAPVAAREDVPMVDLRVDLRAWGDLDMLSLLACQSYNLGNQNDWFGAFRGGWYGMRMRIWGFQRHYLESHSWVPRAGLRLEHEYQLATMLFHMDSAIECMVFAANGLGNAFARSDFHDVVDAKALKLIAPGNVLDRPKSGDKKSCPGYEKHFPRFTDFVRRFRPLIAVIMENHDVSKHREINFPAGKMRMDPPEGFCEAHGIARDDPRARLLAPMETTLLFPDPKVPMGQRLAAPPRDPIIFEHVAQLYARFMSETGGALLSDARSCVTLAEREFRT